MQGDNFFNWGESGKSIFCNLVRKYSMKFSISSLLLLNFLVLCIFKNNAQTPDKFLKKYGGNGIDLGNSVIEIYNRQYVVVGSTTSFGSGSTDVFLILIDSLGNQIWQKEFGSLGNDVGKSLIFNPIDSGFVISGYSNSFGNKGYDVFVIRTDKKGNLIWQKTYGNEDWDFGNDVCLSKDGNIIVCGKSINQVFGFGKEDGYVLKIDKLNGGLIWQKHIGGKENDEFKRVSFTHDGFITLCGQTESYDNSKGDFWFVKMNDHGDTLSIKNIGSTNKREVFYDFIQDLDSNLVLCGSVDSINTSKSINSVSYILKLNQKGVFISDTIMPFGSDKNERTISIASAKNNVIYYYVRTFDNSGFGMDVQPVIGNYNFIFYTATTYGDYGFDLASKIIPTVDAGFVIVGQTINNLDGRQEDILFVKVKDNDIVISGAPITSLSEHKQFQKDAIFYFNETIFFNNELKGSPHYQLYSSSGEVIIDDEITSEIIHLPNNLPSGIYFLHVPDQKISFKFFKE